MQNIHTQDVVIVTAVVNSPCYFYLLFLLNLEKADQFPILSHIGFSGGIHVIQFEHLAIYILFLALIYIFQGYEKTQHVYFEHMFIIYWDIARYMSA